MKRLPWRRVFILYLVLLLLLLLFFVYQTGKGAPQFEPVLRDVYLSTSGAGRVHLRVDVADQPYEHSLGLMNRRSLAKGTGLVFIFESERPLAFWMKNTLIPLDILFFDAQKQFVSSAVMAPCKSEPCTNYVSSGPAKYALEVNTGSLDSWGEVKELTMQFLE